MEKSFQVSRLRHIAMLALLAAPMVTAAGIPSARADDSNSIWNLDQRIFDEVRKGLGLKGPGDADISYRERSPLVVPPSRALPPPQSSSVEANAAWPVDPDVVARREAKKEKDSAGFEAEDLGNVLLPSQLSANRSAAAKVRRGRSSPNSPEPSSDQSEWNPLSPSKLGYTGGIFSFLETDKKDEAIPFKAEPDRTVLTEPPPGYQTPSPAYPYGVTKHIEFEGPAKRSDQLVE